MNWWPLIITGIILFTIVEPWVIIWAAMRMGWRPLLDKFPAQTPASDAVARRFQSFRLGFMNLGFSIHVAVDERWLHLTPAAFLAWGGGAPVSIPWDSISIVKRSRSRATAKIGKRTLVGPAWCLELAEGIEERKGH